MIQTVFYSTTTTTTTPFSSLNSHLTMLIRLSILTLLTIFLKFNNALTINFDDSNPLISYTPITSWSISNDNNLSNNSGHSTTLSGSRVQFSFNGEWKYYF